MECVNLKIGDFDSGFLESLSQFCVNESERLELFGCLGDSAQRVRIRAINELKNLDIGLIPGGFDE